MPTGNRPESPISRGMRIGYFVLGWVMVALGFIGAVLPLMPTTIFLILATWCFGRSSPRLEAWLLDHPKFGGPLRAWQTHGAIPKKARIAAFIGMAAGYILFCLGARPTLWLAALVAGSLIATCWWMATRPTPEDCAAHTNPDPKP